MPTSRTREIKTLETESPLNPSTPSKNDTISGRCDVTTTAAPRRSSRISGISTPTADMAIGGRKRKARVVDDDSNEKGGVLEKSVNAKRGGLVISENVVVGEKESELVEKGILVISGEEDELLVRVKKESGSIYLRSGMRARKRFVKLKNEELDFQVECEKDEFMNNEIEEENECQESENKDVMQEGGSMSLRSGSRISKMPVKVENVKLDFESEGVKVNEVELKDKCIKKEEYVNVEKNDNGMGNMVIDEVSDIQMVENSEVVDKIRGKDLEVEGEILNMETGSVVMQSTYPREKLKQKFVDEMNVENDDENVNIEKEEDKKEKGKMVAEDSSVVSNNVEVFCKGSRVNRRGKGRKRMTTESRKEMEKNKAMELAHKFAFFKNDEEGSEEEEEEEQVLDNTDQVEDWPGPFSTAMKIIRDREQILIAREMNLTKKADGNEVKINWAPSNGPNSRSFVKPVPTLYELCLKVLCENADEIASLDGVPDVIKHRLVSHLCSVRKMNSRVLGLLVSGSPVEIHVPDCSWATEGELEKAFGRCNFEMLKVIELDLSGRCLPDFVLQAKIAKSPNSLPLLNKISLRGNYRLSDDGLNAFVASAPHLNSINLSQCSLITSIGIISLVEKLGPVLRELYIDECQDLNAMLILPALMKLEHLEVLSVAGIETVTDKFVKKLVSACGSTLKELSFAGCRKLTSASVKVIGESCTQLCSLDLRNLNRLNDSALGHLANGCRSIQKLKLCCNAFSDEAVAAFVEASGGSLNELAFNNIEKVAQQAAIAIARRCSNLRSLDLSFCRNLTDEALGLIVDSCSNLKLLKLFGCTQISNVFLEGHSNPKVKIVGLKGGSLLDQIELPVFL